MEQSHRRIYVYSQTWVATLPRADIALQENHPEPGCSNLLSNWFCLCIPYQSQDRRTRAMGKGHRLGREATTRNSRKMGKPVSRNAEPQWYNVWEVPNTTWCSWSVPLLCIFSDASNEAFGSCAYARWQKSNGEYDVRSIAAKSRVAPLKRLTIPRLELQGAVLASRLCKAIVKESRFQFEKVIVSHWPQQ